MAPAKYSNPTERGAESIGHEISQDEWMRPPATAAYLKSSTSTLAKKRLRGDGVPYTKFGRIVLYAKRDCDEYLASRRRLSTSDDKEG